MRRSAFLQKKTPSFHRRALQRILNPQSKTQIKAQTKLTRNSPERTTMVIRTRMTASKSKAVKTVSTNKACRI